MKWTGMQSERNRRKRPWTKERVGTSRELLYISHKRKVRGIEEKYLEPKTVTETVVWLPINRGLTLRFLEVNPNKNHKEIISWKKTLTKITKKSYPGRKP